MLEFVPSVPAVTLLQLKMPVLLVAPTVRLAPDPSAVVLTTAAPVAVTPLVPLVQLLMAVVTSSASVVRPALVAKVAVHGLLPLQPFVPLSVVDVEGPAMVNTVPEF